MNIKKIIKKVLNESVEKPLISEHLNYHITNDVPLNDNIFRFGSEEFFNVINEARELYYEGMVELNEDDVELIESDFGTQVRLSNGRVVYLDTPMEESFISEAEHNGKKVELGKPRRNSGGGKKYVVYVKNPSTGRVKKISFGDVKGGLTAKVSNPKARKSFAARHQCSKKKDRLTAGYWACRLPRFGHLFGGSSYNSYW
jgi:hypothetical protein